MNSTPPGYYSTAGATEPSACGGPSLFCPGGESAPRTVTPGLETFTDGSIADAPTDLNDATTRTSQRACSDGVKCVAGLRVDCRIGSYCVGGKEFLCPPGVVGEGVELTSPSCSRPCPRGSWCSAGSTSPVACEAGTFGASEGLTHKVNCTRTPPGYYSTAGATEPSACGGPSLFCPGGEASPREVTDGFETFTDQALADARRRRRHVDAHLEPCGGGAKCVAGLAVPCKRGSYCVAGTETECPAGTYGASNAWSAKMIVPPARAARGARPARQHRLRAGGDVRRGGAVRRRGRLQADGSRLLLDGRCRPLSRRAAPARSRRRGGADKCTPCDAGTYQPDSGKANCEICTAGGFCEQGAASVTLCSAGFFSAAEGATATCERAPPGFYSTKGATVAAACGGPSLFCPGGEGAPQQVRPQLGDVPSPDTRPASTAPIAVASATPAVCVEAGKEELCGAKCEPKVWCSKYNDDAAACNNAYAQKGTGSYGRCEHDGGKCKLVGDEVCLRAQHDGRQRGRKHDG